MPETDDKTPKSARSRILLSTAALVGVAVVVVAALDLGPTPVPSSDPAEGVENIEAGLAAAGARDVVIPLTFGDGTIDIVYAGAPECSHCQAFMTDGFDGLVDDADAAGLDLAYMPMAMSSLGVSIAAAESCAEGSSALSARELVSRSYASLQVLSDAAGEAREAEAERVPEILRSAVEGIHADLGAESSFDEACYADAAERVAEAMQGFTETFGLTGTPGFFFEAVDGSVRRATGRFDPEEAGLR